MAQLVRRSINYLRKRFLFHYDQSYQDADERFRGQSLCALHGRAKSRCGSGKFVLKFSPCCCMLGIGNVSNYIDMLRKISYHAHSGGRAPPILPCLQQPMGCNLHLISSSFSSVCCERCLHLDLTCSMSRQFSLQPSPGSHQHGINNHPLFIKASG